MEMPDNLMTSLPLILLPALLIATVFILFLAGKRRQVNLRMRNCPHCRATIEVNATACGACHRKISFG